MMTGKLTRFIPVVLLAGLIILRFILAGCLPLSPDEAYYWLWSKNPQESYFDHPFMVALWIRIGTELWGNGPFGVRFLGPLSAAIGTIVFYRTACQIFGRGDGRAFYATLLLNGTIMFGFGMVVMTPDTPLLFFTILSLWALMKALNAESKKAQLVWWCVTGCALGLAFDSKYTASFLVAGIVAYLLFQRPALLRSVSPWFGGLVALMTISPVIIWNVHHQWAGLLKQGGRVSDWHPERALTFISELVGGQIGLATPFIALICFMGFLQARRKEPCIFWLILPGMLVLVIHAFGGRVQANWPAVLYPAFALAGAFIVRGRPWVIGTSLACMMGLAIQGLYAPLPLSAHWDPIARQTRGWGDLTARVIVHAKAQHCQALLVPDYALASILAFHDREGFPIISPDRRWYYLGKKGIVSSVTVLNVSEKRSPANGDEKTEARYFRNRILRSYDVAVQPAARGYSVR